MIDDEERSRADALAVQEYAWEQGYAGGRAAGLEQGLEQGLERGLEQGLERGLKNLFQAAQRMLERGMTPREVCEITGLDESQLRRGID
jgi:flagellar biosynthesis/type III secretory pathway protein FliH